MSATPPADVARRNGTSDEISFAGLLALIPDPRRDAILEIYRDHEDLFHTNPGSSHNHQAWEGGLADHLADMLRLSWSHYNILSLIVARRGETLPFTLGSAQVAIVCHDAEKVVVYGKPEDPRCAQFISHVPDPSRKDNKEDIKWSVLDHWANHYKLGLDADEINAIIFTHGEGDQYRNDRRVMNELAAFVGNIDRTSARILHSSGRDLG